MNQIFKIVIGAIGAVLIFDWIKNGNEDAPARRIFLSHSWKKGRDEYDKFIKKLKRENIDFYNHSIPEEKAFDAKTRKELKSIFRKQMIYCSKIYILAKRGTSPESFVGMEIEVAKELKKPIIAVKPNGQYGIPKFIQINADEIISNNIQSIQRTFE